MIKLGPATLEAVIGISAVGVAGEHHQGKWAGKSCVTDASQESSFSKTGKCRSIVPGCESEVEVRTTLLTDLVEQGVKPGLKRLFVIDEWRRAVIDAVFGSDNPIQRCRLHKERNVIDYLLEEQKECACLTVRAAFSLEAAKGELSLRDLAHQYENENLALPPAFERVYRRCSR